MSEIVLLWLRRELRLADNPALVEAARRGVVLPVAFWETAAAAHRGSAKAGRSGPSERPPRQGSPVELPALQPPVDAPTPEGSAARWWRRRSLQSLDRELRRRGSRLVVRRVAPGGGSNRADGVPKALVSLAHEAGGTAVVWTRGMGPGETGEDGRVSAALRAAGVEPVLVDGAGLLAAPGTLLTREAAPFKVFTPFWRALLARAHPGRPEPAPARLPAPAAWPPGVSLNELSAETERPWAEGLADEWEPGEAGAQARLARLLGDVLPTYATGRDRPDLSSTSRLSPHLHHGELSARQIWTGVMDLLEAGGLVFDAGPTEDSDPLARGAAAFLRQLVWREFAHHLLFAFPATVRDPLRPAFARFPWRVDPGALAAWQLGQTGYPLVDAGMRQLWRTGWMHNRARLVVSSFLVKDLLLPWQTGAAWFWDTLVDADLANNTLGWQWMAGSGADAAPYFRILNPVAQGRRFDPDGDYVRHWLPELGRLPAAWIHAPWQAPAEELERAGVTLSDTYPLPIVDHGEVRLRALAAFDVVKGAASSQDDRSS